MNVKNILGIKLKKKTERERNPSIGLIVTTNKTWKQIRVPVDNIPVEKMVMEEKKVEPFFFDSDLQIQ